MFATSKSLEEIDKKIKDALVILKRLEKTNTLSHSECRSSFQIVKESLNQINKKIDEIEGKTSFASDKMDVEIVNLESLNSKLGKQINSLKMLGDKASKKLLQEASSQINSQLDSLKYTSKKYRELEIELAALNSDVKQANEECRKFISISKGLKSADFNLANYVRAVAKEDHEKLRLMRENEKLKMLISKERRAR